MPKRTKYLIQKYDIKSAFKKDKVEYDFTNVEAQNKLVDAGKLVTNNDYTISNAEAESVLKNYSPNGKSGLGCVFVVESFNKATVTGTIHVIFFDVATNRLILDKKFEEPAGGFGLKNYWAKTIYLTIWDAGKQLPKWIKGK